MPPRLPPLLRLFRPSPTFPRRTTTRSFRTHPSTLFRTTPPTLAEVATVQPTVAVKKPAGAFRSGLVGFLMGSTLAGLGTWFYIMEEYRVSNELLTEDIYVSWLLFLL